MSEGGGSVTVMDGMESMMTDQQAGWLQEYKCQWMVEMGECVCNEVDELCCAYEWSCSQDGQVVVSDDDDGQGSGGGGSHPQRQA